MADPTAVQPDPLLPTYRWNPRARRGLGAYIDRRGRFVSKAAVRAQLDAVVAGLGDEAAGVTRALRAGEVT